MENKRYFLRIKDGQRGGERGHIYVEVPNVYLPDGFVAYVDEHSTTPDLIEVHPADEVVYISTYQYESINERAIDGEETGYAVQRVMEEVEMASKLEETLSIFKEVAKDLGRQWDKVAYDSDICTRLTASYPFIEEYSEVLDKIIEWGNK